MSYTYEVEESIQQICHANDEKVYSTISNKEVEGSVTNPVVIGGGIGVMGWERTVPFPRSSSILVNDAMLAGR